MYLQNKYTRWYYNIIQQAQIRTLPTDVYSEKHHIIPKSLGGNNSSENLVKLTAREHFICHRLLSKMVTDVNKRKMTFAIWSMVNQDHSKQRSRHKINSYTYEILDLHREKNYDNGKMSVILFDKLKAKKYNKSNKKDYYFIVLNKSNCNDVIINSFKGLTILTSNLNNLPFQICWDKNKDFYYENINKKIKKFIECIKKPKPSWNEVFMKNIRTIEL